MKGIKRSTIINVLIGVLLVIAWVMVGMEKTAHVINSISGNPIYKGSSDKKAVALIINVVWGEEHLDKILDILSKENIKATFFIGGKWANENQERLKLIASQGHEIGSHSYNHEHFKKLNYVQSVNAIKKAADTIYSICGNAPILFAPPYGEFNDTTLRAANDLGCKTIMWSVDTIDWRGDGVSAILSRIKKNCHNGAIILSHPTADTVTALPEIISFVRQSGREFITVGEMITDN